MSQKPYDFYRVGEVIESYGRTITEADIVIFVGLAGLKTPHFMDEEFCKQHLPYGGKIAPGFLTAAVAGGMLEDVIGPHTIAALGIDDIRFPSVVRPGDTLRNRITIEAKRDTSDGRRGVLTAASSVRNQRDEIVLEFRSSFLMWKDDKGFFERS